jgi:hypothetical protein
MECAWIFKLNWVMVFAIAIPCCDAIKDNQAENNIYGNLIRYLKMYNDIDVGSILFFEGSTESLDVGEWFEYVTLEEDDLLFESFFPFSYSSNTVENSIQKFVGALSVSQQSSLIVVNNFEASGQSQRVLKYLSEALLRNHIWLFLYSYANITVENFRELELGKDCEANPNLRLNSQVKIFINRL